MSKTENIKHISWETEEQFRLLVEGVTDYAIYMLSPVGIVTSWNAGAERIKGYSREEIIGRHFSCFYTEEDRLSGEPALALATAAKDNRIEREGWRVRKDGSRFFAHIVVDAIRDEAGTLLGFAKITRDITERTEAAAALEKANLALSQAQKLESIGRLTGGIAHDFNNLLAVISNSLDLLAMKSQTHLDMKIIGSMRRAIERGSALNQQLLSFARQQPLQADVYNLNALITDFEPMLARACNHLTKIALSLQSQHAFALIDPARFEATLLNLVVNAIDAMPTGGTVTVTTQDIESQSQVTTTLAAGRYVQISVIDTGTGMPKEVLAQAMEPFFTTKPVGKGTGLGLSQVHGFANQSGGDVLISSEEGKGTTVHLYFPIVEPVEKITVPGTSKNETVLLIDDEPEILSLSAEIFRSIGYKVILASSATDAVEILRERKDINVVFTDISMPHGMSGLELARLVKTEYTDIKVILTSGHPMASVRRENSTIIDFAFVQKPYRLADLVKALRA
ncbi:PAS domain-containing sensor histidine kinase [Delftia sp. HK171]|uniref:PAS domain-containing sensor histidine kinase n=1 Tax=Delftia sp. HK171 TaxID=1920191 RepID=UPI001153E98E|nr:PAS domain-containing sensor histidine kinase [Delftia sp. HK171]TQL81183.1 PAS domain S-box-containing protein [Delftia sp. HK171]